MHGETLYGRMSRPLCNVEIEAASVPLPCHSPLQQGACMRNRGPKMQESRDVMDLFVIRWIRSWDNYTQRYRTPRVCARRTLFLLQWRPRSIADFPWSYLRSICWRVSLWLELFCQLATYCCDPQNTSYLFPLGPEACPSLEIFTRPQKRKPGKSTSNGAIATAQLCR